MTRLGVMREIRRELRRRGIASEGPAMLLRRRLAVEMAKGVPYDVATVERFLDLAVETDLTDPETFLAQCSVLGLDPITVLNAARTGLPFEQRFGERRPPVVWTFRLQGSRGGRLWLYGAWLWLFVALAAFSGALRYGSIADLILTIVLVLGASLAIHVESRRLP